MLSIRSALPSLRSGLSNIQYAKLRLPSFHTVAPPLYQTPPSPPWLYPPHDLCVRQCPVHGCAQVRHKVQHRRHQVQRQRVLDVQQPAVKAMVQRQADQLVCSLRRAAWGQGHWGVNARKRRGLGKRLERQRVAGGGPGRMAGRRELVRAAARRSMRRQGGHHCCTVQSACVEHSTDLLCRCGGAQKLLAAHAAGVPLSDEGAQNLQHPPTTVNGSSEQA